MLFICLGSVPVFAGEMYKTNVEASYYGDKFHGSQTASGETFSIYELTAAHKTLPFNTLVKVTNLANGKSVVVRINDRGPFAGNREIDLSKQAAIEIGMIQEGLAHVSIEIVGTTPSKASKKSESFSKASETPFTVAGATVAVSENETAADDRNERFDIQVGAYSNKEYAQDMASALSQSGFSGIAYQQVGSITRVVIRDLSVGEVSVITEKLKEKGVEDFIIRKRTLASSVSSVVVEK